MNIRVKFFASLRERYGIDEHEINLQGDTTVDAVWQQLSGEQQLPANVLIAINMEYVEPGSQLKEGDEVAFFPPVTGG